MKLCLAGKMTESDIKITYEKKKNQSINILQSYFDYQLSDYNFDSLYNIADFFILDSGAFSMLYGNKRVNIDNYVMGYIDFIKRKKINNFIELDLYNIIGKSDTERLRKKIENETGRFSIPVFHKELGLEYFTSLVKNYQYIAIGGLAQPRKKSYPIGVIQELIRIAKKNNCKVHGLGYTSTKYLPYLNWFSVDSTSWLAASRFGKAIDIFNGHSLTRIKKPKGMRMKPKEIREHQLKTWLNYMKYVEKLEYK